MKTYLLDILPKFQRFSEKLDDITRLTSQHWVLLQDIFESKVVYIFREKNELLISDNGTVARGRWEHLGNTSLMIEKSGEMQLFKHGYVGSHILALKLDGKDEFALLTTETYFNKGVNCIAKAVAYIQSDESALPGVSSVQQALNASPLADAAETFTYTHRLKFQDGVLEIDGNDPVKPNIGDRAYVNNLIAPDGKYYYGRSFWNEYVVVKDGIIVRL